MNRTDRLIAPVCWRRASRWRRTLMVVIGLLIAGCAAQQPLPSVPRQCDATADAAVAREDWATAQREHERVLGREPHNCLALYHLGYIWGQLGDRTDEVQNYEAAIHCGYTQDDRLYFNLGMAYGDLGRTDQAVQAMELATRLNPTNADNYFGLGLMEQVAGNDSAAEAALQRALRLDRHHWEARLALVRIYLNRSRWKAARRQLDYFTKQSPGYAEAQELREILESREAAEYGR